MPDAGRRYRRLTGTHGIPLTSVAVHLIRAITLAAFVTMFVACYMPIGQYQSDSETAKPSAKDPGDEGSGTEEDPYIVDSKDRLVELLQSDDPEALSAHYQLADDLDLTGEEWEPIDEFTGSFDGKGYIISGLTPKTGAGRSSTGFFGTIEEGAVVCNVQLEVHIDDPEQNNVGAIAGINKGTIANSFATGFMRGNHEIGGLVSINEGLIEYSYARMELELDGGRSGSGGLVGVNRAGGVIYDSYAAAAIRDADGEALHADVGGLVGTTRSGSTVERSFSDRDLEGPDVAIGDPRGGATISNVEALSTGQAKSQTHLSSELQFDFDAVWAIDPDINDGYPYLRNNPPEA